MLEKLKNDLPYNEEEACLYAEDYMFVYNHAMEKDLKNTLIALPVVRSLHNGLYRGEIRTKDGSRVKRPYIAHCLAVAKMLINLKLTLTADEEDIAIAAALCHDLPAFVPEVRHTDVLFRTYGLSSRVVDLVDLIYTRDCVTEEDFDQLFERVSRDKLAMLVKLADRGNVVESLHDATIWRASEYIHETRSYYLPLCIHAREQYPELDRTLGILQEKLREIIEACAFFSERYMNTENELIMKILQLTEDNARMRIRIRKLQENAEDK